MVKPGTDKDKAVGVERARNDGIAFAVADAPKFVAGFGFVSADKPAASAYDLGRSANLDFRGRAEGKVLPSGGVPRGFPANRAGGGIESGNKWILIAVATKHEQSSHERGRSAIAVN